MAKLWQTLLRGHPAPEVSRYDVSWFIEQLNSPYAMVAPSSTSRFGQPVEDIENSFTAYVRQGYKNNGVIFAIILARLLLFAEARFAYRAIGDDGMPGALSADESLGPLRKPWPNGTAGELLARAEQDASLGGNFFVAAEVDRLRRLRPDWTTIVLTAPPEEAVESDVAGYMYSPGGPGQGEPRFYLPLDVAHWSPIPDPDAQYRGMSWLTPVIREMQADDAATRHKSAFFGNGAKPGLVVSLKESVTADQFKKFIAMMNDSHQGADQAYKTLYVGGGADVTVAGADLRQLDFRATQGAGETRLCAAGGVPPIIVGLSEGLASATYSNYGMARRKFGDHWARPMWRSICAALAPLVDVPAGSELWYDDRDIAFLREDQKDASEIQQIKMTTITGYVNGGFTAESAIKAVEADDRTLLEHTGMTSVQLQEPGAPEAETPAPAVDETARAMPGALLRGFDPNQKRDPDGKFGDGIPGPPAAMDWAAYEDLYEVQDEAATDSGITAVSMVDGTAQLAYDDLDVPGRRQILHDFDTGDQMTGVAEDLQSWLDGDDAEGHFGPDEDIYARRGDGEVHLDFDGAGCDIGEDDLAQIVDAMRRMGGDAAQRSATWLQLRRARGARDELKRYWLGEGLSKWATSAHPWTALYEHLVKHMAPGRAKRTASQWFHDYFGIWPGERKGANPVGPG